MKRYFIEVERECDDPAKFHVESDHVPTNEEIEFMFKDQGYEDDWEYIGRIKVEEVFANKED